MKLFRSVIFWTHLAAGLVAGIVIGIMCFTGATLAFETEIIAWAECEVRHVTPAGVTSGASPHTIAELFKKVRTVSPETRPSAITLSADPHEAVAFTLGRDRVLYGDPSTGEVRAPASNRVRNFLRLMNDWHRYLAFGEDRREIGKAINGACNLAFFLLAVSGLYLWLPRRWSWRSVRAVAFFDRRAAGRARDFNWHNTVGLWCAPVFIVLTLTAVPIAYRWGGTLIYQLAGEEPPAPGSPGAPSGPAAEFPPPPEGTRPLDYDALLAAAQRQAPGWESIILRVGEGRGGGRSGNGNTPRITNQNPGEASAPRPERSAAPEGRRVVPAATVTIKFPGSWPRTAATTLTLNPYTGDVLKRETFADLSPGRRLRTWTRFVHTGQALGWGGQLVAGLACLGGCLMVYTGLALAWRRFFGRKPAAPLSPS